MTTMAVSRRESLAPWWLVLIEGIAAVILGLMLFSAPAMTTAVLVQVVGIYWLISGMLAIITIFIDSTAWGWKLLVGALGIIAGFTIIQHPLWSTLLVPATIVVVMGVNGLIMGVINLIQAFQGGGWGAAIVGGINIVFGLLLLGSIAIATLALPFVLGIFALVGGVIAIIGAFRLR